MDSAEVCSNLRQELRELDASFRESEIDVSISHGDFRLVGHGEKTNENCGKFLSFYGCIRTELHDRIQLDGQRFVGQAYVRKTHFSCDKPSCPVCYKKGWAVREAIKIEERLSEAAKRFGLVEHIICSVPVDDYGLSHEDLRSQAVKALFARGIVGGVLIFHGFRYNQRKYWYWNPHFHVLGFILGGYGRCRRCERKWNCRAGCGGFDDRNFAAFQRDGWFVKVLDKRKTVGGTAWYQLNHSSVKVNVKRFHVATWFGVASYRKLKLTPKERVRICPICRHDLVKLRYFGGKGFVKDRNAQNYERESFEDLVEDGRVVWVEAESAKG